MERIRRLTLTGVLSGLALALMFLEFPIFPQAGFLKYDPSEIVVFFAVVAFGLRTGIWVVLVKGILFYFLKSGDPVGIAMNITAGIAFAWFINVSWRRFRKLGGVVSASGVTAIMVGLNALVVPLYFKAPFDIFWKFLPFIVAFNLIKFGIDYYIGWIVYRKFEKITRLG